MHALQGVGYRLSASSLAEPSPVSACVLMNRRDLVFASLCGEWWVWSCAVELHGPWSSSPLTEALTTLLRPLLYLENIGIEKIQ